MSLSNGSQNLFPRTLIDQNLSLLVVSSIVLSKLVDTLSSITLTLGTKIHYFHFLNLHGKIEYLIGLRLYQCISEAVYACIFAMVLPAICIWYRGEVQKNLEIFRNNLLFYQMVEQHAPHVLQWYKTLNALHPYASLIEWWHVLTSSPSIFGMTPAEAIRRYKTDVLLGKWRYPPPPGTVSLHFFHTQEAARYPYVSSEGLHPEPHLRIDLRFDHRNGLDLNKARKLLGVEKLSIVAELPPCRSIFEPVDQNRLSPVASYDLSKQFTEPIRVFEPCPSKLTAIKRKIHEVVYLSFYFVIIFLKSLLGFKISDPVYLTVTYGKPFATRFSYMSQTMRPLNRWTREGLWLLAQLVGFTLILPLATFYQIALYANTILSHARFHVSILNQLLVDVIRFTFSFNSHLSTTRHGRVVRLLLIWLAIAELLSLFNRPYESLF